MTRTRRSALVLGAALAAVLTFAGVSGCDDDDDSAVVTGASCSTACNRYRTCFNSSFDVAGCTNQCQSALNNGNIIATDADDCLDCIGEAVCAPAYNCANACDFIIVVP
jgi:hypothetical protein